MEYNRALKESKNAGNLEDDGEWELYKPELSIPLWKMGKSFDWQIPLFAGGMADWPEWFIHDMAILNWQDRMIRRDMGLD